MICIVIVLTCFISEKMSGTSCFLGLFYCTTIGDRAKCSRVRIEARLINTRCHLSSARFSYINEAYILM